VIGVTGVARLQYPDTVPDACGGDAVRRLSIGLLGAALIAGGCATVDYQERYWETPTPPEGFVTGSKLPRSQYLENYQGTKTIKVEDYHQYKGPRYGEM
jgi:hypothetical protein